MKTLLLSAALSLAAVTMPRWVEPFFRDSNSVARTGRGVELFNKGKAKDAVPQFEGAKKIKPGPAADFNLGTAEIAAGELEKGAASIGQAMRQPSLRADAFYNRGSGALKAKAAEHAIQDLTESLKLRPSDRQAKRNLEIALRMKKDQDKQKSEQKQQPSPSPSPDPQKGPGDPKKDSGKETAESILRSVQQQEKEELSRMRKVRPAPESTGW